VEWVGFDTSHLKWVHRDVLMQDVPAVVRAYEADPSAFKATTLGIVLHTRSRAIGGEDVVGEVKGVEEVGV